MKRYAYNSFLEKKFYKKAFIKIEYIKDYNILPM